MSYVRENTSHLETLSEYTLMLLSYSSMEYLQTLYMVLNFCFF